MRILVACEESQAVTIELRKRGHEAYSCDIEPTSGNHPEWHLQQDVAPLLREKWDMIIAFPPCTYLSKVSNRYYNIDKYGEKAIQRYQLREDAKIFFMQFVNADCPKIAIENPVGVMSTHYRKPNQIIQPWQFGHPVSKATCLWLKGLPELVPTTNMKDDVEWRYNPNGKRESMWHYKNKDGYTKSKTFHGIARAMAEQWAGGNCCDI